MALKEEQRGRYANVQILDKKDDNNQIVKYLSRRFIPHPKPSQATTSQTVQTGDRPDLIAYRAYDNPLLYYRLADYNLSMNPFTLTSNPGRILIVPTNTTF
ncbi:MAG: Base plate wedge protein 53 [Sneathiella sp.]